MFVMYFEHMFNITYIYVPIALVMYPIVQFFLKRFTMFKVIDYASIIFVFYTFLYTYLRACVSITASLTKKMQKLYLNMDVSFFLLLLFCLVYGLDYCLCGCVELIILDVLSSLHMLY